MQFGLRNLCPLDCDRESTYAGKTFAQKTARFKLPKEYRSRIITYDIYPVRKHPDIRIARRANTITRLARVISERKVSKGLRRTLLTQASRLEKLAAERLKDFPGKYEEEGEEE